MSAIRYREKEREYSTTLSQFSAPGEIARYQIAVTPKFRFPVSNLHLRHDERLRNLPHVSVQEKSLP